MRPVSEINPRAVVVVVDGARALRRTPVLVDVLARGPAVGVYAICLDENRDTPARGVRRRGCRDRRPRADTGALRAGRASCARRDPRRNVDPVGPTTSPAHWHRFATTAPDELTRCLQPCAGSTSPASVPT